MSKAVLASEQAAEPLEAGGQEGEGQEAGTQEAGGQEAGGQAGAADRDVGRAERMWISCPYCGVVFAVNNSFIDISLLSSCFLNTDHINTFYL